MDGSDGESSAVHFALDELLELLQCNYINSVSSNRVDYLNQLLISVPVLQLLVDVPQVVQVQLALALHVQQ